VSPANSIFSALILSLGVVVGALNSVTYAQEAPDPAANVDEAAYDQARSISAAFHQTAQRTLPAAVTILRRFPSDGPKNAACRRNYHR